MLLLYYLRCSAGDPILMMCKSSLTRRKEPSDPFPAGRPLASAFLAFLVLVSSRLLDGGSIWERPNLDAAAE
jgi:hypothetical protein